MFNSQNKIIIVDNNEEHLSELSKPFYDKGIGCRTFTYDPFYNEPLSDVRVAFFDINLNDLADTSGNNKQIFTILADAIKRYVQKKIEPFALIFWTQNKDLIENFKEFVVERNLDIPDPFIITYIDKHEFLGTDENLEQKLFEVLGNKTIELLFDFEQKASVSASKTINQVYEIVPKSDSWGENTEFNENFERVFSRIAVSTLGFEHAKINPDKAVYEALLPMLNHNFINSLNETKWKDFLTSLKTASTSKKIGILPNFKESKLNSVFHIDSSKYEKDTRGVVIELDKRKIRVEKQFIKTYLGWARTLINFKKDFKANVKEEKINEREKLLKKSRLIAIEISAACDFSQNNNRLNKYLLGLVIPKINKDLLNQCPSSSLRFRNFEWENKEIEIWINLNYSFAALATDEIFKEPLFLLKKEIMDSIGNKYANHVSRIGITSF